MFANFILEKCEIVVIVYALPQTFLKFCWILKVTRVGCQAAVKGVANLLQAYMPARAVLAFLLAHRGQVYDGEYGLARHSQ